jgi:hypothetical protein
MPIPTAGIRLPCTREFASAAPWLFFGETAALLDVAADECGACIRPTCGAGIIPEPPAP